MSGGDLFGYDDLKLQEMCFSLEDFINDGFHDFSFETIQEFKKGLTYLKLACVYAKRIDYLVSADDGEESFHKRLKEDLQCNGCCSEISQLKCDSCGTISLVQITESSK